MRYKELSYWHLIGGRGAISSPPSGDVLETWDITTTMDDLYSTFSDSVSVEIDGIEVI